MITGPGVAHYRGREKSRPHDMHRVEVRRENWDEVGVVGCSSRGRSTCRTHTAARSQLPRSAAAAAVTAATAATAAAVLTCISKDDPAAERCFKMLIRHSGSQQ